MVVFLIGLARGGAPMGTSILIVDDSELARTVLASRLTEQGATVVCASSVKDALEVDAAEITTAIVDVDLAGDDGVSLAEVLAGRNPRLRLALFTATGGPQEHKTFRKPHDLDDVVDWALGRSA